MPDYVGEQFGSYRLTKKLESGGFADVYLGEHIFLDDKKTAIKVLKGNFTEQDIEEFRKEAQTIHRLQHPNIIQITDFNVITLDGKNIPFLVMDYAPHGSLRKRHSRGTKLPLTTILSYVKPIAAALQYAHDQKVIHRDVKPANLLLGKKNELLLSDFGNAVIAHATESMPMQDKTGTWAYMAPEQFVGKPRPASDQYALGIVVYEWLGGEPPFAGPDFDLYAYQHTHITPPPLGEIVFPAVEAVVMRALAKDPKQRFASVQEFASTLKITYREEIKRLLDASELTVDVLRQEYAQDLLLNQVAEKPDWWKNSGQAKITTLRKQAEKDARTDIADVLSTLAAKAVGRVEAAIERDNWEEVINFLLLINEAAPPSANPKVWIFLLKSLSTNPRVLKAIPNKWKIHSWLLERWGSIAPSVDDECIRLWFPTEWSDIWGFLALSLPREWHDRALIDRLDATSNVSLTPAIVRSVEQKYQSLIENYCRGPFRTINQLDIVIRLFVHLRENGYARKMELLNILLAPQLQGEFTGKLVKSYIENLLIATCPTKEEIVQFLENYGPHLTKSHYEPPIVSDYIRQYFLAFSPSDLDRTSARQLLQFMTSNPSLPLKTEVRALAQSWYSISTFVDRPTINKKGLSALASAISQLPSAMHAKLLDKLGISFISCIKSEVDLMCVIYAMSTVLTGTELLYFLQRLAEFVNERYRQKRSEAILIPYVRVALQAEAVFDVPSTERQEFIHQFLETLLQYANKKTYKQLDAIVQNWPIQVFANWHSYVFERNPPQVSVGWKNNAYLKGILIGISASILAGVFIGGIVVFAIIGFWLVIWLMILLASVPAAVFVVSFLREDPKETTLFFIPEGFILRKASGQPQIIYYREVFDMKAAKSELIVTQVKKAPRLNIMVIRMIELLSFRRTDKAHPTKKRNTSVRCLKNTKIPLQYFDSPESVAQRLITAYQQFKASDRR